MSYDSFATTFSNSRKNHPWPELEYIIADMKTQNYSSILDIGCGNGRFLEEAQKLWYVATHYLGIDSSGWMIQEAQKLHPDDHFEVIWMQDLSRIQESFDTLLFLASFHHLESQEERIEVLHYAKNLLSPSGRIYMTNWNLRDQVKYEKDYQENGDFDIKIGEFSRYYHGFTILELEELFGETWYKIIENRIFDGGRNIVSVLELRF